MALQSMKCPSDIFLNFVTDPTGLKMEESSANSRIRKDILSVRSFIYIRKGPCTDTWGTPELILLQLDIVPLRQHVGTYIEDYFRKS